MFSLKDVIFQGSLGLIGIIFVFLYFVCVPFLVILIIWMKTKRFLLPDRNLSECTSLLLNSALPSLEKQFSFFPSSYIEPLVGNSVTQIVSSPFRPFFLSIYSLSFLQQITCIICFLKFIISCSCNGLFCLFLSFFNF